MVEDINFGAGNFGSRKRDAAGGKNFKVSLSNLFKNEKTKSPKKERKAIRQTCTGLGDTSLKSHKSEDRVSIHNKVYVTDDNRNKIDNNKILEKQITYNQVDSLTEGFKNPCDKLINKDGLLRDAISGLDIPEEENEELDDEAVEEYNDYKPKLGIIEGIVEVLVKCGKFKFDEIKELVAEKGPCKETPGILKVKRLVIGLLLYINFRYYNMCKNKERCS